MLWWWMIMQLRGCSWCGTGCDLTSARVTRASHLTTSRTRPTTTPVAVHGHYQRGALGGEVWSVVLMLMAVELVCVGLWAATGAGMPLLAALAAGVAIVYLVIVSGGT